jgi:hypothetical protein
MAEFQVKQTGSSTYLVVKGIPSVVNRAVITLA